MTEMKLSIAGMSCGHCIGAVKSALEELDGVKVEQVVIGSATVSYDPATTQPDTIAQAVEDAGYEATVT